MRDRLLAATIAALGAAALWTAGRGLLELRPVEAAQGGGSRVGIILQHTGMVGVLPEQTLRLNAVRIIDPDQRGIGDPNEIPVRLLILDGAGHVVAGKEARLRRGEATFLDFQPRGRAGDDPLARRTPLRGSVHFLGGPDTRPGPPAVVATLEVWDTATGATVLLNPVFWGNPED